MPINLNDRGQCYPRKEMWAWSVTFLIDTKALLTDHTTDAQSKQPEWIYPHVPVFGDILILD